MTTISRSWSVIWPRRWALAGPVLVERRRTQPGRVDVDAQRLVAAAVHHVVDVFGPEGHEVALDQEPVREPGAGADPFGGVDVRLRQPALDHGQSTRRRAVVVELDALPGRPAEQPGLEVGLLQERLVPPPALSPADLRPPQLGGVGQLPGDRSGRGDGQRVEHVSAPQRWIRLHSYKSVRYLTLPGECKRQVRISRGRPWETLLYE